MAEDGNARKYPCAPCIDMYNTHGTDLLFLAVDLLKKIRFRSTALALAAGPGPASRHHEWRRMCRVLGGGEFETVFETTIKKSRC